MSYQKLMSIIGPILLGLLALYLSIVVPIPTGAASTPPETNATYAKAGTYPVGTQTTTAGDTPLTIMLWYPAMNDSPRTPDNAYRLQMKMGPPMGAVTVATYAGNAIPDAPYNVTDEPYPLVVMSPGFGMGVASYGWLAEHLASYGFVVAAPEHPEHFDGDLNGLWRSPVTRPADVVALLDHLDQQTAPGGPLENVVDMARVGVVGHSYGGYTTLAAGGAQIDTDAFRQHCADARASEHPAAWLCDEIEPHLTEMAALAGFGAVPDGLWQLPIDPRIDALVPIAGDAYFFGPEGLRNITVPVMAIGGTHDEDTPWEWGPQPTYDNVSSTSKILVGLHGADHMIFTGPCEAIPLTLRLMSDEFCTVSAWGNPYEAHHVVKHFAAAFLLTELQGDSTAAQALTPGNVTHPDITYMAEGY